MLTLASYNYGPYALVISCVLWLCLPFLMIGWYVVQIRAITRGERTSLWLLVPTLAFSFLPGLLAYSWLVERGNVNVIFTIAAWASIAGLVMLPLTVTLEILKLRRDLKLTALERRKGKM